MPIFFRPQEIYMDSKPSPYTKNQKAFSKTTYVSMAMCFHPHDIHMDSKTCHQTKNIKPYRETVQPACYIQCLLEHLLNSTITRIENTTFVGMPIFLHPHETYMNSKLSHHTEDKSHIDTLKPASHIQCP